MRKSERGFSLVEILVVMALMGIVVMAIYALHSETHKTANTSEEVVEVQQNLRFALDQMARDIRMAGFLIPAGLDPIASAPETSWDPDNDDDCTDGNPSGIGCFTLRMASTTGRIGRIGQNPVTASPSDPLSGYELTLASADMVDLFSVGDHVRILRPGIVQPPLNRVLEVTGKDRANARITLEGFNAATVYREGDVLVRVLDPDLDGDDDPNTNPPAAVETVVYRLRDDLASADPAMRVLVRETLNGGSAEIGGKITGLQLSYLLSDGSEETSGISDPDLLERISAVRVRLTGATDATRTGQPTYSGVKTRTIETLVKLRNR